MRDLLPDLVRALDEDGSVVLATVVGTWGSAPQPAGAAMLRRVDGRAVGSISGGCVEGAVYELAEEVQATGEVRRSRFEVSDDDAIAIGLTCGGTLEVHVQRLDAPSLPFWRDVLGAVRAGRTVSLALPLDRSDAPPLHLEDRHGASGWAEGDLQALAAVAAAGGGLVRLPRPAPAAEGPEVFVSVLDAPPRMLVYGAVDFAAALTRQARLLGFRTTVCDARGVFATRERFPDADEVVVDWPHRHLAAELAGGRTDTRTAVCVLTHDEKFDVPLLVGALSSDALGYVGAMGSARTHHRRLVALGEAGLAPGHLARLHSPIGLHLGGRSPAETALSIVAEVVAERNGASMRSLRGASTPIHGRVRPTGTTLDAARR